MCYCVRPDTDVFVVVEEIVPWCPGNFGFFEVYGL